MSDSNNNVIDLRSDTVTTPCAAMREAMAQAEVGDAVIDIDPTAQRLEEKIASMLGKPAAIFMPSGSMTNQTAIRLHCQPGDEMICDLNCHIYNYEQAAFVQFAGVVPRTVEGKNGLLRPDQLHGLVRPSNDHMVRTRLVCLENTHNRGGGNIYDFEDLTTICKWAHKHELKTHLDGARLFNAVVASGIDAAKWSEHFDTVSVCFSKGLGAPVGSALAGSVEDIAAARRQRKVFGGAMRQSGIIAAGALYALENNVERLANDHKTAAILAEAINDSPGIELHADKVETNIVIFRTSDEPDSGQKFVDELAARNVSCFTFGENLVRLVTHLHISEDDARTAGKVIGDVARKVAGVVPNSG